jgi:competence protein ComEC
MNPGGFDWAEYLERRDIDFVGTVVGTGAVRLVDSGAETWRWGLWNQLDRWRQLIRDGAANSLSQPALGLFLGIIIGERGFLQSDLQEWFMATGTVHLLSISGSHLGFVALVVYWVAKRGILLLPPLVLVQLSRTLTASRCAILLTWVAVFLYALLAGAELATVRSLVMITLGLAALWLGHDRHLHHAMAVAALIIILHDPRAIFDISFQLSFLSVLTMLQIGWWINEWRERASPGTMTIVERVSGYARDVILTSGTVTLAALPLVALYFNQVSWMGIVTNLIAIPFTGVVLVPLGLFAAACTVVTAAGTLPMGGGLEHLLRGMIEGLRWCTTLSGAEWHVSAPSLPSVVVFYAALVALGAAAVSLRVRLVGAALVLCLAGWWMVSPRLGPDGDRWRVTFLDVGQGDSAVIELPDGRTVLIDGGARYERLDMGSAVVAPFLWNRGIRHIDTVVGTHQQMDHVSGLIWVLRHFSVGQYWGTGVDRSEQFVADLKRTLNDRQLPERLAVRGLDLLPSGPCRLAILNPIQNGQPDGSGDAQNGTTLNNQSIVSRLQCGVHSILFTADVEVAGLRALGEEGRRPVTLVKVPHHGARSSLDDDWLVRLQPRYAVVSAGRGNPYGHPTAAVLRAYEAQRVPLYRTDQDGAVWITGQLSTSEVTVLRTRDLLLRPVDPAGCFWLCEQRNWRRLWFQFADRIGLPAVL